MEKRVILPPCLLTGRHRRCFCWIYIMAIYRPRPSTHTPHGLSFCLCPALETTGPPVQREKEGVSNFQINYPRDHPFFPEKFPQPTTPSYCRIGEPGQRLPKNIYDTISIVNDRQKCTLQRNLLICEKHSNMRFIESLFEKRSV